VSFSQYEPYGPVVETTMRIATWNVWGRFGRWRERQAGIEETLAAAAPDVVCLVESWSDPQANQPALVARRLGYELRMLTGRTAPAAPGLVCYDAWEIAGDGTPGHTWSNRNPLAAVAMYPDRRMDYVLSAWPRRGGVGHPVRCQRLGVRPADQPQLSDHYGVLADLRY